MGSQAAPREDFYWVEDREPHFQRRKEILKAHPEVTKLFGVNPRLKYVTVGMVIVQLTIALYAHLMPWWMFLLVTFAVGATIAQALFLAIHEITHDLAFKTKVYNNWLAFIANLPIVLPFAMSFKVYHGIHHWDQGKDGEDMDIPTVLEAKIFRGFIGKVLWFFNQIVFYALRPTFGKPIKPDKWMIYNIIFQVAAMAVFLPILFQNGWAGFAYLILSLVFAGGLHPTAGHFISVSGCVSVSKRLRLRHRRIRRLRSHPASALPS